MKEMCEIKIPAEIKYSEDGGWISASGPYRVGISDFTQDALGELIFAELPVVGAEFNKGQEFGALESEKGARPLLSPADIRIVDINDELNNDPAVINHSPYDEGWVVEVELKDPEQLNCLLDAEEFKKRLEQQGPRAENLAAGCPALYNITK